MIKLKTKPPVPQTLNSAKVTRALTKIEAKLNAGQEIYSNDFPSYWLEDDVRLTLWEHQQKKCCYCERKRDPKREPDIEHFRPKTEISEVGKPGYWWLAYNWDNLFFSCKKCNQTKGTLFPVLNDQRVRDPNCDVNQENPILLHPEFEDPEEFIHYHWDISPIGIAAPIGKDTVGRGSGTIRILGLDDPNLNEERGRILLTLHGLAVKMHYAEHIGDRDFIKQTEKQIERETRSDNNFTGLRRTYFIAQGLGKYISAR